VGGGEGREEGGPEKAEAGRGRAKPEVGREGRGGRREGGGPVVEVEGLNSDDPRAVVVKG
jgi:hypothetical protein